MDPTEQLRNDIRQLLNAATAIINPNNPGSVSLHEAKDFVMDLVDDITPYPGSPDPDAFPFVTVPDGEQKE